MSGIPPPRHHAQPKKPAGRCLIFASEDPEPVAAAAAEELVLQPDVIVDVRERDLLVEMSATPCLTKALHVGDIWIGCSGEDVALILERKTIADFEASIIDGRYREQRGRLLAFSQERAAAGGTTRIAYVLEGRGDPKRLAPSAIRKLTARAALVHGLPVFRTQSTGETADLIADLVAAWRDDPAAFKPLAAGMAQTAADGIHVVKKANADTPELYSLNVLCQCTGVSVRIAEAWMAACGSLAGVFAADEKTLAEVKVGTRRVGPAVAGRLKGLISACGF